jgi:hypothetical protein
MINDNYYHHLLLNVQNVINVELIQNNKNMTTKMILCQIVFILSNCIQYKAGDLKKIYRLVVNHVYLCYSTLSGPKHTNPRLVSCYSTLSGAKYMYTNPRWVSQGIP